MLVTDSDMYVSAPLTNISIGVAPDTAEFVSARLFPIVPVRKQAGKYYEYPRGAWFRSAAQERGKGQESAGTSFQVESKDAYYCQVFALHVDVDDYARANVDTVFQLDADVTRFLQGQILLRRELSFLAEYFATGKWGVDFTPAVKWGAANAKIFKDIRDQLRAVKEKRGIRPNVAAISENVWDTIQESPDIIDRIKGGATPDNPAIARQQQVAAILGLDEIIVTGAVANTAAAGAADNFSYQTGDHMLLLYRPRVPGLMTPAAGYTFVWNDLFGVGPEGERVLKFRMEALRSDRIEAEANWDHRALAPDLGVFIHDVL
jgi:hypothetical protein